MWDILDLQDLLLIAVVFLPLERIWQLHHGQGLVRPQLGLDLLHALFTGLFIKMGLIVFVFAGASIAAFLMPPVVEQTVSGWPLYIQAPLAIAIADLGFYWVHRLHHRIPLLWNFHAVHHSIENLDWLAGHRVHPVDQVLTKGAGLLPLFALGFSDVALWVFTATYFWQSTLLHSNVGLRLPWLSRVIALPHFHHWHHANEPQAMDKNFGGQFALFDVVFGTFYAPDDQRLPQEYGTDDPVPNNYVDHLTYPFKAAFSMGDASGPDGGDGE